MRISDWSSDVCSSDLTTAAAKTGANWHDQLQQEIGKIDREQQQEQSRSDANEARLAELQKQRDDLERERQKLAAQAKASSSAGADRNTSSAVTSAGEAPATPAKAKIRHIPTDRASVVEGKSVSVRVNIGGRGN